jgi:DNA-binding transcriptional ArsR family regulator
MASGKDLISWMKAAGEPSRLRLLALCADREYSVTDLSRTLRQSGPRVSRHLKILCEAGLLERVRQGQWVHYQLSRKDTASQFVRGLLAQLNRDDAVLLKDRQHARLAESAEAPAATAGSRLGRSMRAFIDASRAEARADSALIIGARHMELLEAATDVAAEGVAAMSSRRAAQAARTFIENRELPCKALVASSSEALRNASTHGAVIIEHLNASTDALTPLLTVARNALPAGGRIWVFVQYEALEGARTDRVVEHPLARMRRLLNEAGFACQQMSPIEADGEHVLATVAVRAAASTRPASVA